MSRYNPRMTRTSASLTEQSPAAPAVARVCPVCAASEWKTVYSGPVRVGKFPNTQDGGLVRACTSCGVQRLDGEPIDYTNERYRALVETDPSPAAYYRAHDVEQVERVSLIGLERLRGQVVVDVGAGAGSFLDAVKGVAARTVAIEPSSHFHAALRAKGHEVYSFATDAVPHLGGKADVVTSFAVIEHIEDLPQFTSSLAALARPGGRVIVSTPNARDWLLEFSQAYASFFYRIVHRWYFDEQALARLLAAQGLKVDSAVYRHRFDVSNALGWLKEQRPSGLGRFPLLSRLDGLFRDELERQGRSDYFYLLLTRPPEA